MDLVQRAFREFAKPFRLNNRWDRPLISVFFVINGIVFANACLHDPRIGYDAIDHLRYIQALSEFRLVAPSDSPEFFSPPFTLSCPSLTHRVYRD